MADYSSDYFSSWVYENFEQEDELFELRQCVRDAIGRNN